MSITANVNGTIQLGGGIGSYICYKIEVSHSGKSWIVYRRFRDFCSLHAKLEELYGKEPLETANVKLPDHSIGIGKTLSMITSKRATALQDYLRLVLALEKVEENSFLTGFFDTAGHGKSGAVKELGVNGILLETFGFAKPCFGLVEMWNCVYLVLSKAGTLYVFKNYDDGLFQALVTFPIAGKEIHVLNRSGSKSISLTCTNASPPTKLLINLPGDMLVASWLRSIADFSTRGESAFDARPSGSPSPVRAPAGGSGSAASTPSSVVIKSKGTGNTTDELSAMYGVIGKSSQRKTAKNYKADSIYLSGVR